MLLIQPLRAARRDRVGRKPMMIFFGVGGTAVHLPDLHRRWQRRPARRAAFALVMAGLVIVTGYTSINAIVKAELFPAAHPRAGRRLPFAIANTIFGGTAEYVALWLKDIGHEKLVLHLHFAAERGSS